MENIKLRREREADYPAVKRITFEAFKTAPYASGDEALLAHKLRLIPAFVTELDYVAEISVLPARQRQGVGAALIQHTLELARRMGFRAVLIFGHEEYYPRFGFENAAKYGITITDGKDFDAFMALPLYEGSLNEVHGRLIYDPLFDSLDRAESDAFNTQF